MLHKELGKRLVIGTWFAVVALIIASSIAVGAALSTSALLLLLCVVPLGVALILGFGSPDPTVAELLRAVDTRKP